jgi:hypothetical protein
MSAPALAHLLQTPWTFYYHCHDSRGRERNYEAAIQKIAKVVSVEEFWGVYSRVSRAHQLKSNQAVHFFRCDSRAMWEDDENREGGCFRLEVQPNHAAVLFEKLLLDLIGEQLHPDFIGVVVSKRRDTERIDIWHRTWSDPELRLALVRQILGSLEMPLKSKVESKKHNDRHALVYALEADGPVLQDK